MFPSLHPKTEKTRIKHELKGKGVRIRQRELERRGPTPQSKKETSKSTWEKAWIKRGKRSVVRGAWGTWSPRESVRLGRMEAHVLNWNEILMYAWERKGCKK